MAVGGFVLVMQSFPIFMNNWVFLTEPRGINKTNENGEQLVSFELIWISEKWPYFRNQPFIITRVTFKFVAFISITTLALSMMKWKFHVINISASPTKSFFSASESDYKCYLNPLFSQVDLSDVSLASLAVISEWLIQFGRFYFFFFFNSTF